MVLHLTNSSITLRLAPRDIIEIDDLITKGFFTSRSDLIRTSVRHYVNEIHKMPSFIQEMSAKADEKQITKEKIVTSARKARPKVYKEAYGDG